MGLNCGCPAAAALPSVVIPECAESMGQIQKLIFQRIFSSGSTKNGVADPLVLSSWTPLLAAADGTKAVVSPYISAPTSEAGAARKYGGGNATLNGIEVIVGREPGTFSATLLMNKQSVIIELKRMMCENIGVFLVDDNGSIGCLVDSVTAPTKYMPIPIHAFFVGDKKFGGLEEPDANMLEFGLAPNWSDNFVKVQPTDFNALTDLVYIAPTPTPTPTPTP